MVLGGTRKLSKDHIHALCDRFDLSPAVFFDRPAPKGATGKHAMSV
ncbi:HTH-type transcriptional regulator / antitoxin HigA [Azotobacter vinelandii]|nr:HTH-type transcriptional regulator / antitoxin HigA [Azotobacter vinelandii]